MIDHAQHLVMNGGIVVIQVGLMGEEAVPEILARLLVHRPVRRLGVEKDDARIAVLVRRLAPDVIIAVLWVAAPRRLKPPVLI